MPDQTPLEADFDLFPDDHLPDARPGPLEEVTVLMDQLKQTQANVNDLFARLSTEKTALDRTMQCCAERDVQGRVLLSAVGEFAERQRCAEEGVRALLELRSESDRMLEEGVMRMFKERRERDEGIRKEIGEVFRESVRRAQEVEKLLRWFGVTEPREDEPVQVQPAVEEERARVTSISTISSLSSSFSSETESEGTSEGSPVEHDEAKAPVSAVSNPFVDPFGSPTLHDSELVEKEFVTLTPIGTPKRPPSSLPLSPPLEIHETKREAQEWDFFDAGAKMVSVKEDKPQVKVPTSFTDYRQPELGSNNPYNSAWLTEDIKPSSPVSFPNADDSQLSFSSADWSSDNDFPAAIAHESFADVESSPVTPVNKLSIAPEPVDETADIPVPEWAVQSGDGSVNRRRRRAIPTREIMVKDIRIKDGDLELSIRMLDSQTIYDALEELTKDLTEYHCAVKHELAAIPAVGDFVSVQSFHRAWHRGQILGIADDMADVLFIDSGFDETVSIEDIRALPTKFRALPQQARKARLSFVKLPGPRNLHHAEALEALQKACMGRKLAAKLDHEEGALLHLRLMDPGVDPGDILASVNGRLLRGGLATIDERCPYLSTYQFTSELLADASVRARQEGVGMYRREMLASR